MEYIQAILFTFKYILGQSGNTDILYLFSAIAFFFYAWKRHDKLVLVLKVSLPVAIVCVGMALFYPQIDILRVFVFLGKMIFNITFMVKIVFYD